MLLFVFSILKIIMILVFQNLKRVALLVFHVFEIVMLFVTCGLVISLLLGYHNPQNIVCWTLIIRRLFLLVSHNLKIVVLLFFHYMDAVELKFPHNLEM